jgi:hypothetical protein
MIAILAPRVRSPQGETDVNLKRVNWNVGGSEDSVSLLSSGDSYVRWEVIINCEMS